jgi:hypothetical protein
MNETLAVCENSRNIPVPFSRQKYKTPAKYFKQSENHLSFSVQRQKFCCELHERKKVDLGQRLHSKINMVYVWDPMSELTVM